MRTELFREWTDEELSSMRARELARSYGVKLPKLGHEVSLGNGLWLASTGHHKFGWFGREGCKAPYRLHGYRRDECGGM